MPRNLAGLRHGGPGRPKGSKGKRTLEMNAFWKAALESKTYLTSALRRVNAGKAPHLEAYWMNKINGKPPESVVHSGEVRMPAQVIFELHTETVIPAQLTPAPLDDPIIDPATNEQD